MRREIGRAFVLQPKVPDNKNNRDEKQYRPVSLDYVLKGWEYGGQ